MISGYFRVSATIRPESPPFPGNKRVAIRRMRPISTHTSQDGGPRHKRNASLVCAVGEKDQFGSGGGDDARAKRTTERTGPGSDVLLLESGVGKLPRCSLCLSYRSKGASRPSTQASERPSRKTHASTSCRRSALWSAVCRRSPGSPRSASRPRLLSRLNNACVSGRAASCRDAGSRLSRASRILAAMLLPAPCPWLTSVVSSSVLRFSCCWQVTQRNRLQCRAARWN